jgi:hypothetical protein
MDDVGANAARKAAEQHARSATGAIADGQRGWRRLRGRIVVAVRSRVHSLGKRLFGADDARARNHGWLIEVKDGGLGRTYRDPRFEHPRAARRLTPGAQPEADEGVRWGR